MKKWTANFKRTWGFLVAVMHVRQMQKDQVAELEARLNDVTSQLAERIATVRSALLELEDAAAREGHILNAGAEDR
jgi:hypothetical protein